MLYKQSLLLGCHLLHELADIAWALDHELPVELR